MKSLFAVLVHSMTFITVARGSLPAPANVYFDSHNFEHVLRWHPGTGTPAGTQYRVQYRREGNNWSLVGDCLNVTYVPECNLTGRLENMEYYKARVQAFNETHQSNWKHSVAFQPVSETILGPPSVTLSGCGNCLLLNMSSPRGSGVNSLQDTYYNIDYNVHLRKSGEEKQAFIKTFPSLKYFETAKLDNLGVGQEYCVMVSISTNTNRNAANSSWSCEFTSEKVADKVLYILISLAVLLVSAILLIAALVYCGYLCQDGAALPQVLVSLQVSQNENDQQRCLIGEDACISKISYFCKPRASWATESSDEEEAISDQEECYENRAFRASEMEPVDTEDGDDSTGTFSVEVENIYELQRPEEQLSLNVDYKSEGCLAQQELQPEPPSCEDITAFNEVPLFSVILGDVDKNLIDSGQKACNGDSETSNHSVLPSEQASLLGETVTDADYRTEGSVTGAGGAGDPWYSSEDEPDDGQPSDYMARLVAPS